MCFSFPQSSGFADSRRGRLCDRDTLFDRRVPDASGREIIVNGTTPAKNSALTSAGAKLRLTNGVLFLAKFDGEFASHSSTRAGTVRYTW